MPEAIAPSEERFAAAAVRLGAGAMGTTWPNPAVGSIVVRDGIVQGRGRTAPGGRPHGEALALAAAGEGARGATMFVSLEPCAHHGRTPPCSETIAAAGVGRVVATMSDPDPRVTGRGITDLRTAGLSVATGACAEAARWLNAGHVARVTTGRPWVTLKLAISADAGIGRAGEGAVPITGETARRQVQALRARYDAILVGRGTVEVDDPQLTCRLPGLEWRSPVRIVLDSDGRLLSTAKVFDPAAPASAWVVSAVEDRHGLADGDRVIWLRVARDDGGVDLGQALAALAGRGITRVLVEGGAAVASAFLAADLVDEAIIFQSPDKLGEGRVPVLGDAPLETLTDSPRFRLAGSRWFGSDRMMRYERRR